MPESDFYKVSNMSAQDNLNREADEIRNALKNIPYEILLKERQANLRVFDQQIGNKSGNADKNESNNKEDRTDSKSKPESEIKHKKGKPIERSCKERPSQFKPVFEKAKTAYSDPRFEEHAGELNMSKFLKSYHFLKDAKKNEITKAESFLKSKKKIKKMDKQIVSEIKQQKSANIQQINQMENLSKKFEIKQQLKKELKAKGLNPKFIKKREVIRKHRKGV